ncbi:unnamed protein product [Hydatigera taeniaeformis]|uniref:TACC_C domain-containing protein n=1 Tax=Hydatigena taeniaeformis TaxID=6205 RepID=A0A0R3WNI2_HYDTA|nr:unnamed protein product [Hydatigera taeniaeformis]
METKDTDAHTDAKVDSMESIGNLNQVLYSIHSSDPQAESDRPLFDCDNAITGATEKSRHPLEIEDSASQRTAEVFTNDADLKEKILSPLSYVDTTGVDSPDIINLSSDFAQASSRSSKINSLDASVEVSEVNKEFNSVNSPQASISTSGGGNDNQAIDPPSTPKRCQDGQKSVLCSVEEPEANVCATLHGQDCLKTCHFVKLQSSDYGDGNIDSTQCPISEEESIQSDSLLTESNRNVRPNPENLTSVLNSLTEKDHEQDILASAFSSIGEKEDPNQIAILQAEVEELTKKLLRSQEQMEILLEEKQRWLAGRQQQTQSSAKQKISVSSDTAAIVVKFAQSEQQRIRAEAKVEELEATITRLKSRSILTPDSAIPSKQLESMEEFNKALVEARERAEHLRHALRQEETRVSDLSSKLATTREAHRNEQKRAAGQAEVISKLNRDIDSLKRQLQEANKVREREAKRLCDEVALHETTEKYNRALSEVATLQERIAQLEEVEKFKMELESRYEA